MQQKAMLEEISIVRPQDHHFWVGHAHAAGLLQRAANSGQLPHGWLFSGPKGIGKATLAYRFARMLLSGHTAMEVDHLSATGKKISENYHPDMLILERQINEKTDKQDAEIKVETIRRVNDFLSLTASISPYRIILVDSVDDLNINAANALLKNLEEPPAKTIFLLINHRPEAVLPTIASRCIQVRMQRLNANEVQAVVHTILPQLCASEQEKLALYAAGSPGMAAALHAIEWEKWVEGLITILQSWPHLPIIKVYQWIESILKTQSDDTYMLGLYLYYMVLSRGMKYALLAPNAATSLPSERTLWANALWHTKQEALVPLVQNLGKMATNRKLIHAEKRSLWLNLFEQLRFL